MLRYNEEAWSKFVNFVLLLMRFCSRKTPFGMVSLQCLPQAFEGQKSEPCHYLISDDNTQPLKGDDFMKTPRYFIQFWAMICFGCGTRVSLVSNKSVLPCKGISANRITKNVEHLFPESPLYVVMYLLSCSSAWLGSWTIGLTHCLIRHCCYCFIL